MLDIYPISNQGFDFLIFIEIEGSFIIQSDIMSKACETER